jgi:argininosuccinate lyase
MYCGGAKGFHQCNRPRGLYGPEGAAFRSAYKIVGQIVAACIFKGAVLETLPLETYREFSELFGDDLYKEISLETCVAKRISAGGTGKESVEKQIAYITEFIGA